ncbi:MAG TPA: DMT family transporter [Acidimicrobiia bacterium]|nr:DMT family transporter [Acidimicrobiia bacterium]
MPEARGHTARREHTRALFLALFVTMLWASSWVLIRWGLDDEGLRPVTFAGIRYLLAAILLAGITAATPGARFAIARMSNRSWVTLSVLGLVFVTLAQGAQFVAIDSQPAATTSLILSLTPLLVAGVSNLTLGERPGARQVVGAACIVLGATTYFLGDLGFTPVGMLAAGVGLLANASGALIGRAANRDRTLPPLVVTVVSMGIGALALVVGGVAVEGWPGMSGRAWLIVLWLAGVNTALAFTLWNRSLQHLSATESAAINNTMLIQIGLLAWAFLDEVPGLLDVIGMLAVSAGVYLASRPRAEIEVPA